MFVFWYCHKRGKEVRLAKEAAEADGEIEDGTLEEEAEEEDDSYDDEEEDQEKVADDTEAAERNAAMEKDVSEKANILSQPEPTEVPLPAEGSKEDPAQADAKPS